MKMKFDIALWQVQATHTINIYTVKSSSNVTTINISNIT